MVHRQTHNTTRAAGSTRRSVLAASMALPFVAGPAWSASGDYPDRPIRLVVPLGPGGVSDIMGRLIAEHAGKLLGQPIVVDNRPGAGGVIGSSVVAQAPADGYNLLLGTIGTLAISPSMTVKMPYDPDTAFTPISLLAGSNFAIIANHRCLFVVFEKFPNRRKCMFTIQHIISAWLKTGTGCRQRALRYISSQVPV